MRASFRVLDDLPPECRVGLFSEPATYDAQIRFSNGAFGASGADVLPNIRGIALKLSGVPGQKLLPGEENSQEHDFLMANHRSFFVSRIEHMLMLSQGKMGELAKSSPRVVWQMLRSMFKFVGNPLKTSYFSQVPYRLGDNACKYAVVPVRAGSSIRVTNVFDKDYMRHSVERSLHDAEARFMFCIQLQQAGDSIADSTKVWKGELIPVAEVTVLQIDSPVLESDGEALSFNPWRVLPQHQPLGWPGRVRRAVYAADFAWRAEQNADDDANKNA